MNIRLATFEDIETITGFQMAMALETEELILDRDILRSGIEAAVKDEHKGRIYVAEESAGGKVIGSLMITLEWSDWRNGWIWWIESLYVLPECRKKGVFQGMYDYIKSRVLADAQVKGLRLYVDKRNIRAQKVYEAIGMSGEHYTTYEWLK